MKVLLAISLGTALLTMAACEQTIKVSDTYTTRVDKLKERAEKVQEFRDVSRSQRAVREERGDTLSLSYEELQKLLPASVNGYTAAPPSGRLSKMSNLTNSVASSEFKKDDTTIKVELVDYNGTYHLSEGAVSIFAMLPEGEDKHQLIRASSLEDDGVLGIEIFRKNEHAAQISLAVGGRFLVKVTADKQTDLALVESVAQQVDLKKLAKL
ncbi:hypothetical protein SAMN06265337_0981 [Hymenobacter gelipurpurascens]|uniref:DUF4251 domain-containing protein n=1 Tax=Hymenobacter gelipurpurascens TaxID=89968 RepID=A0A212TDN5_9BACT|nr:hypothetical protein [Hymenobacter gelipurpurascens]SNC63946.1 hypothetical protein SAMN06265337_0981 [Hymenobacter gelipurpurascens]